jgi:DNA-binding IscR family transcriptional regulator
MEVECSLKETWEEVRDVTIKILERTNFATLAKRAGGPWVEVQLTGRRTPMPLKTV